MEVAMSLIWSCYSYMIFLFVVVDGTQAYRIVLVCCLAWQVSKLEALGFSKSDCENALSVCHGQLDKAATWLTKHVKPVTAAHSRGRLHMSGFEVLYCIFY